MTGGQARESVTEAGGAGCIELSHESIACIYLSVKTNRKYKKKKRIGEGCDDRGSRGA